MVSLWQCIIGIQQLRLCHKHDDSVMTKTEERVRTQGAIV